MSSVTYRVEGDIAVVEVNNPPVNALSHHVREGIQTALDKANEDQAILSIVLCGKVTFLGGADITEFKDGTFHAYPSLTDIADIIENSNKPIVAGINGFALGGGFELAICCHYRVAHEKANFGFPEVNLGILPAATGTQRFPRLVGLKAALDIIPSGRCIGAKEALSMGAVDKVVKENLLVEALKYAQSVAKQPFENRRISKMTIKDAHLAVELRDAAVRQAQQKMRGQMAPTFCIKSVMAAVEHPYDEGLEKEAEYANILFTSGQSKAMQYTFFAERAASKWDVPGVGSHKTAKPLPLTTGAVIGAGTMGTGIAMAMLNAGISVTLLEQNKEFLKKGVGLLRELYAGSVRLRRMSAEQAKAKMDMLKPTVHYKDLENIDIVVEAVYENMSVKKEVFRKMDEVCKPDALLCSNTSSLNIDEIANATSRPDKVIGTHFFVPAYYMRLLENVRGMKSSAQTIATAQKLGAKMGKVSVLVGNCDGFAANRMRAPQFIEALFLLEEGCTPREVDQVLEDFGLPMGPLKVADLSGLDINASAMRERLKKTGHTINIDTRLVNGVRIAILGYLLVKQGRCGRKTGKGFYCYDAPYGKVPYDDPWMINFLEDFRQKRAIQKKKISPKEIEERLLYSAINEGFKIMEDGICSRPEEIDALWFLGFGWPRYLGGPMFYANMVGVDEIYKRVCHYQAQHPTTPHWQPAKLLHDLANNQVPFKDWSKHSVMNSRL